MLERVRKITQTQQDFNLKEQEHKSKNVKKAIWRRSILRKYLMLVRNWENIAFLLIYTLK
jgi:hypothetical protein